MLQWEPMIEIFPVLNVFVIDNDLSVSEYIKKTCSSSSYDVIPCFESTLAANFLLHTEEPIHLILIEVHMPLMNAYELMEYLNEEQINVPVIMMSTDGSWASIMKSIEVGACDYWIKPLSEERVVNMWIHAKTNIKDKEQKDIGSQKDDDRTRVVDDFDDDDDESDSGDNVQWSVGLQFLFHQALIKVGLEVSKPKDILEMMNVPSLELEDVESHLEFMRTLYGVKSSDATELSSQNLPTDIDDETMDETITKPAP